MTPLEDARKRPQTNSPEKQPGVRSHDRKRQNTTTSMNSDMEESEPEANMLPSPSPLAIPPPTRTNAKAIQNWNRDREGDTTMVDSSPTSSPSPPSPTPGGNGNPAQTLISPTSTTSTRDYAWIAKRTRKPPPGDSLGGSEASPPLSPITKRSPKMTPAPTQYADTSMSQAQQPRLPHDLERTPTPIGGFPVIHLSTPPWYNLLPEQKLHFAQYPEPKAWIRDWQASKDSDLVATSECLKNLIQKMTGERAKLSSPQQEKNIKTNRKADRQKPPYHFLITGLSERAHNVLMAFPIISTREASAFIIPYCPPVPRFLLSLEGFTLSIKDDSAIQESEYEATRIVRDTLRRDENFITLIKSSLNNDITSQHNLSPAMEIIEAIEVRLAAGENSVPRVTKFGTKKPTWNVYFAHTPPIDWVDYFAILMATRTITFVDMDYGSATPVSEDNRLHCFNCKSADHNQPNCEYTRLEGWFSNTGTTEKIEETAEFASSSKHTRDIGSSDKRRGFSRGRGRGLGGRNANNYDRK